MTYSWVTLSIYKIKNVLLVSSFLSWLSVLKECQFGYGISLMVGHENQHAQNKIKRMTVHYKVPDKSDFQSEFSVSMYLVAHRFECVDFRIWKNQIK